MFVQLMEKQIEKRKLQGNCRTLPPSLPLIDFASNDYLGLARTFQEAQKYYGSTGSRLLTGNSIEAELLEKQIAAFHGYEDALLYNCGYMANLGLISAIMNDQDAIFFDINIHASAHDGIRLSKAKAFPFRHNDLCHLEKRLKTSINVRNRFICIESIYSTDGSMAPLFEICQLAKLYSAYVIVDEAHATGVFGALGEGLIENQKIYPEVIAKIVTFSKGLGTHGAVVLGTNLLKQFLLNFSHSQIYTTALPPQSLATIKCAYERIPLYTNERQQLKKLIELCIKNLPKPSKTHIQPFYVKGNLAAKQLSKTLADHGFNVIALLSPTVQQGKEILRLTLHSYNCVKDLTALINLIRIKQ